MRDFEKILTDPMDINTECEQRDPIGAAYVTGHKTSKTSTNQLTFGAALGGFGGIKAAVLHVDLGAISELNGASRSHLVDIGVTDGRVLALDIFQELDGVDQSSVGAVVDFGFEANRTIGSSGLGPGVLDVVIVGAAIVPGEANKERSTVLLVDDGINRSLGGDEVFLGGSHCGRKAGSLDGEVGSKRVDLAGQKYRK